MIFASPHTKVYLAMGSTDMRKSFDSLAGEIVDGLNLDPFSGHLFVFCNRRNNIIKILYWDRNGFCIWNKRLEEGRFKWPKSAEDVREIGFNQLIWMLDGMDIIQVKGHKKLNNFCII